MKSMSVVLRKMMSQILFVKTTPIIFCITKIQINLRYTMKNTQDRTEYDLEPVSYCPKCYSLKIGYIPGVEGSDYCMDCGCVDVVTGNIYDWEKLYEDRYGHKYVTGRKSFEGHPLWNLPLKDLRRKMLESQYCMDIIRDVYPDWNHHGKLIDMVFLFFDNVIKDKLLSKLKKTMIIRYREGKL